MVLDHNLTPYRLEIAMHEFERVHVLQSFSHVLALQYVNCVYRQFNRTYQSESLLARY